MPFARTVPTRETTGHRSGSRSGVPRPDDKLGRVLRLLRWPVAVFWLLAIVALYPLASSLSSVTSDSAAAYLPSSADSTKVVELEQAAQHGLGKPDVDPVIVVFARSGGLTAADQAAIASVRAAVAQLAQALPGLSAPGEPVPSADGTATYLAATVTTPAGSETAKDIAAVQPIRQAASAAVTRVHDGLQVAVTGQAAIVADSGVTSKAQTDLRLTALTIIVVILLLVYRRPLLWLFPLFGAIGAIVVAEAGAHGLGSAGLTVSSLSASILIVLTWARQATTPCCWSTATGKNYTTTPLPRTQWQSPCGAHSRH